MVAMVSHLEEVETLAAVALLDKKTKKLSPNLPDQTSKIRQKWHLTNTIKFTDSYL